MYIYSLSVKTMCCRFNNCFSKTLNVTYSSLNYIEMSEQMPPPYLLPHFVSLIRKSLKYLKSFFNIGFVNKEKNKLKVTFFGKNSVNITFFAEG